MTVSDQLRQAREASGLSCAQLADAVGVNHATVERWESGRCYPGKGVARRLEALFGVVLRWDDPTDGISADEEDLLAAWRALKPEARVELLRLAHQLALDGAIGSPDGPPAPACQPV